MQFTTSIYKDMMILYTRYTKGWYSTLDTSRDGTQYIRYTKGRYSIHQIHQGTVLYIRYTKGRYSTSGTSRDGTLHQLHGYGVSDATF